MSGFNNSGTDSYEPQYSDHVQHAQTIFTVVYTGDASPPFQGVFSTKEKAQDFIREDSIKDKKLVQKDIYAYEIVESRLDDVSYSAISRIRE